MLRSHEIIRQETGRLPEIAVLCGAQSPEREVSLRSGKAVFDALAEKFPGRVAFFPLDINKLPAALDPRRHVVFPFIHGDYGEDGTIQRELDALGFAYAGCGADACRLCIDKPAAKQRFATAGARIAKSFAFTAGTATAAAGTAAGTAANAVANAAGIPTAAALIAALGSDDIVIKPADKGSSVGLRFATGTAKISAALDTIAAGATQKLQTPNSAWLAEPRITGREMTIGILDGDALGIVEIRPKNGCYDYDTKYTAGASEYIFPADVTGDVRLTAERAAEAIFAACGCRDFARADFILGAPETPFAGECVFLEINTHPGMTATSLFPKSASCRGLDFDALCARMLVPALKRFESRNAHP
jgi:D-alanine-D-alanine ligase